MGVVYVIHTSVLTLRFTATAMDPHSTRSQFNRRGPKAGPPSRNTSEKISMQDTVKMPSNRAKTDETSNLLIRRPIATNSRVKQDEMVRRNMYLSFVINALQQKSNVGFQEISSFPMSHFVGRFAVFRRARCSVQFILNVVNDIFNKHVII